ncbi:MAG: HAMP domain-containing histidine kinase [Actinomycetota bacterium]|nr:HAMP domain-containing histidine kinase [Actinomycetota bacterium]
MRITLVATALVAVALIAGSFVLVSMLTTRLTDTVRTGAQAQADQIATALAESGVGALRLPEDDDRLVQVLDSAGDVIRSSSAEVGPGALSDVASGESAPITVPFDDDGYLAVAAVADTAQGRYTVVAAHALDRVVESRRALTTLLAAGVPILLLLLGLTTWRVVGGALAPVEAIRREVDEVSAKELHRRVPQPGGDDEISRLAVTMNRMLARLETAGLRQRQFVSDASHELRSPMATIRAHAEVVLAHPDRATAPELAETVLAESLRVQQLVENLLVLARADEQPSTPLYESVDLDDLVFGEAQRLGGRTGVALDTSRVSGGRVRGDAALLRRVIGNLLDNAVRHANSRVEVSLREHGDVVVLRVDDDGQGVARRNREAVFARFSRLDDARARDDGGAGLGLAIVAEVVTGHGGTVKLTESSAGGARFDVRLPRSAD